VSGTGLHLVCRPKVYSTEGADHVGIDAFMRCPVCRRRTIYHYEYVSITPKVREFLAKEWRAGRTAQPKDINHGQ
jgi:hypothetical protein